MTNPKTKTTSELLAEETIRDPEFQREWEKLEFARLVAAKVIEYRSQHNLTQRTLATKLNIPQSQIARLENAEHNPSHDTLTRLTQLNMEFTINIKPRHQTPKKQNNKTQLTIQTNNTTTHYIAA